jgi:hypothetical protein
LALALPENEIGKASTFFAPLSETKKKIFYGIGTGTPGNLSLISGQTSVSADTNDSTLSTE